MPEEWTLGTVLRWIQATLLTSLIAGPLASAAPPIAPGDRVANRELGLPYYSGGILPAPRHVERTSGTVPLAADVSGRLWAQLRFGEIGPVHELLTRLWSRRLQRYCDASPDKTWVRDEPLMVLFTQPDDPAAAALLERYGLADAATDLEPQGYALGVGQGGIVCVANDASGWANGMASLVQLTHVENGQLVADCVRIIDSPEFARRWVMDYAIRGEDFLDFLALYKVNGYASGFRVIRWDGLSDQQRLELGQLGRYIRRYGTLAHQAQIHIGGRDPMPPLDIGDDQQIKVLLATITETMKLAGTSHIMLCCDDVPPHLSQPRETATFKSLARAHEHLIDIVYDHVQRLDPKATVSFVPPFYQGMVHPKWRDPDTAKTGRQYLRESQNWNPKVWSIWTGPQTGYWRLTVKDFKDYRALIGPSRKLMWWDNAGAFHAPLANFYCDYPANLADLSAGREVMLCIIASRPRSQFHMATAMDYYWSGKANFDVDYARNHGVLQFLGPEALPAADAFYALRGDAWDDHFRRDVDLDAYRAVLERLEATSWNADLMRDCWACYERAVNDQRNAATQQSNGNN